VFVVNVGHFFFWPEVLKLHRIGAHPNGGRGWGVTRPQAQRNRNLKNTGILYMTSKLLHD